MSHAPAPRRRALTLLLALLLLAPLAASRPALAQGTDGMAPDPITSQELGRYADRLGLSPSQRSAFERLHDDYKAQFRLLREGEIEALLGRAREMDGGMPSREAVKEVLDDMDRVTAKVAALDRQLFDAVAPLLTPDQLPRLERVRLARARTRASGMATMAMMGGGQGLGPELATIIENLDLGLDPERAAAVDATLDGYERRLTRKLEELAGGMPRMFMELFDRLEAEGLVMDQETMMEDPEKMQAVMEAVQRIMMELMAGVLEQANELFAIERAAYRAVAVQLEEDDRRAVRDAYYGERTWEVGSVLRESLDASMRRAAGLEQLDAAQRRRIEDARRGAAARMDAVVDDAITLAESARADMNPMRGYDEEAARVRNEKREALVARAAEIWSEAALVAEEALGEKWRAVADSGGAKPTGKSMDAAQLAEVKAESSPVFTDGTMPGVMPLSRLREACRRMGLSDDETTMFRATWDEYVENCRALPELDALSAFAKEKWARMKEGQAADDPEAAARRGADLRRRAVEAMRRADAEFMENLGLLLAPDDARRPMLDRLREYRERTMRRPAHDVGVWVFRGNASEAAVELAEVLMRLPIMTDQLAPALPALADYHEAVVDLLEQRFAAQLDFETAQELWQAEAQRGSEGGFDGTAYQRLLGGPSTRLAESNRAMIAANRRFAGEIAATLPGDAARDFRRAYDLAAWPGIYADPFAVVDQTRAALALEDLAGDQRDQLLDLAAVYPAEYEQFSRAMVAIDSEAELISTLDWANVDWQDVQERERRKSQIAFDRNEASFRAASRLRSILTESQVARIGGLPEAE